MNCFQVCSDDVKDNELDDASFNRNCKTHTLCLINKELYSDDTAASRRGIGKIHFKSI